MSFDPKNCARGINCQCVGNPEYYKCRAWARSTLSAPRINFGEPHYTGMSKAEVRRRVELKEAGEYAILNRRPFTPQPLATDKSPAEIRRAARERNREQQSRFRKVRGG
jgi:hypothetical protein